MIWLASFPRSGNTFFRNVLFEVYGIKSSTFHIDPARSLTEDYDTFPVVKTHLLPNQLKPASKNIKSVYLVRDGRDALVSISHHRKDIVEPGSDFYNNLLEAILAQRGSYFGGWSQNVKQWVKRADIIIKFEDLIQDPIREVEKLRAIMDLPPPNREKLPTFEKLKFGKPAYGSGKQVKEGESRAQLFFRRGKSGSWKDEMPTELEELFWSRNHAIMNKLGYDRQKTTKQHTKKRVLIEASKFYSLDNDGVKRYVGELLLNIPIIAKKQSHWHFDLLINNHIKSLHQGTEEATQLKLNQFEQPEEDKAVWGKHKYEIALLQIKKMLHTKMGHKLYAVAGKAYRSGPFRSMLNVARYTVSKINFPTDKKEFANQLSSYDLIHVPLPQSMDALHYLKLIPKENQPKVVVTAHDLTHRVLPDHHTKANIKKAEQGMQEIIKRNGYVIAISDSTRNDVHSQYGINDHKIKKVLQSANQGIFNRRAENSELEKLRKKFGLPDSPYFMCLSTIEPRKNLVNTIKGFLLFKQNNPENKMILVICGRRGWKFNDIIKEQREDPEDIYFTGFVDDNRLPALYRQARALCYISHYEGFGLPLLEAMACGTPTIYGDNSSMPEVVGPTGLPADSQSVEAIATAMQRMATDDKMRSDLSESAWRRSNQFTWMKTALDTMAAYDDIIND